MIEKKILDRVFLALSREPNVPKVSQMPTIIPLLLFIDGKILFCLKPNLIADCRNELKLTETHFFLFIKFSTQTYVQDLASKEADAIYKLVVEEEGHIYVCGDVTMAEHVYLTIRYDFVYRRYIFFYLLPYFFVCCFSCSHIIYFIALFIISFIANNSVKSNFHLVKHIMVV